MGGKAPPDPAKRARDEAHAAYTKIKGLTATAAFFSAAAGIASAWLGLGSREGLLYVFLFFGIAFWAAVACALRALFPLRRILRSAKASKGSAFFPTRRRASSLVVGVLAIAAADFLIAGLAADAPWPAAPLDIQVYNARAAAVDVRLEVQDGAGSAVYARTFHLQPQNGTDTGVIATAQRMYVATVTVDAAHVERGIFLVDPSYWGAWVVIEPGAIRFGQAVT